MKTSIVLPTRNAGWCLHYALKALLNLSTQPDEYVICIGKSEDNTEQLILDFQKQSKIPVNICYDNLGIGTGYAMNQLVSKATGDIILWANSDGIKSTEWVSRIITFFNSDKNISYLCNSGILENPNKMSTINLNDLPSSTTLKYISGIDPISGIIAFKKSDAISAGNFDSFFTRGQDFDMVIRLSQSGKIGADCGIQGYHFGVYGGRNLRKGLKTGTFFKFLYKYGYRYCLINPHHFGGIILRTGFLFSTIMFLLTLLIKSNLAILFGLTLSISLLGLSFGLIISHKKFTFNLLLFQLIESIGEFYQLYLFMNNPDKQEIGYGKKWLRK